MQHGEANPRIRTQNAGLPAAFARRAATAPHAEIWRPGVDELVQAASSPMSKRHRRACWTRFPRPRNLRRHSGR